MKISELFDENLNPKWDYIWTIEPFHACIGVKQNTDWHRETLDKHIRSVTEHMKDIVDGNCPEWISLEIGLSESNEIALMAAALCHDFGKAITTYWDEGLRQWKCKNHGSVGEKIVRELFFDEPDIELRETVCWLVRHHMAMHNLSEKSEEAIRNKIKFLSSGYANFIDFAALFICDCLGSDNLHNDDEGWVHEMAFAKECVNEYSNHAEEWKRQPIKGLPDVIVMCGISGSGKSTWSEKYAKEHDYKIISRDSIREELGMSAAGKKYKGNKSQEDKVTEVFNQYLCHYINNHVHVIIDNMNLQERYRKAYKELLKDYDLKWECVYVEAPTLADCEKRREGQLPDMEIERMLDRLDFPRPYEFDEVKLVKQSKQKT